MPTPPPTVVRGAPKPVAAPCDTTSSTSTPFAPDTHVGDRHATADRRRSRSPAAPHCGCGSPRPPPSRLTPVDRGRDVDGVGRASRHAVVPRRPDAPVAVDVGGRERERAEPGHRTRVPHVGNTNRRIPRGAAVRSNAMRRSQPGRLPRGRRRRAHPSAGSPGTRRPPAVRRCRRRRTTSGRRRPTSSRRACRGRTECV